MMDRIHLKFLMDCRARQAGLAMTNLVSSLAGARSVLLASRMAIQLDCFGARRLAMTASGYTIFESALGCNDVTLRTRAGMIGTHAGWDSSHAA